MPIHRHLDEELRLLRDLLVEMANLVDEQFVEAVDALLRRDAQLAGRVRDRDDEVDALEMRIDRQCERILALHQPVAVDLRMLIIAVKINTDLERIGDHCKNLAKNAIQLTDAADALASVNIRDMADASRAMLRDVQDAFLRRDRVLARRVLVHDEKIDRLHKENFQGLVAFGQTRPDQINAVAQLVTASKALERISDHAKNIAENVVFLIEGVDIRHRKLRQVEPRA